MDRFVAFLWNANAENPSHKVLSWSQHLLASSPRWAIVLDRPGLRVLSLARTDRTPVVTPMGDTSGIVIGPLFERGSERSGRVARLTPQTTARIMASNGGELVKSYWGNYVAIWKAEGDEQVHVVRDPCGAAPCFRTASFEVGVLCSHIADIAGLADLQFTVDWNALRAFLLHNYFITEFTGLREVKEILPGQRMTWQANSSPQVSWVWNAATLAVKPKKQSFDDARAELRETAESCFAAWGSFHRNIIVRLSGGLDSSIVASLMRRKSDAKLTALHIVGQGYEGFELKLAKLAAKHAGIDLLEFEISSSTDALQTLVDTPQLARPTRQILGTPADALVMDACEALGADCVMGGHGGDSVFLQRSIASDGLTDYLRLNGLRRDGWRVAYETAVLLEQSVWHVLKHAAARSIGRRKWNALAFLKDDDGIKRKVLTAEAAASIAPDQMVHDWLLDAESLPPCKAEQTRGIVALRNYHPVMGHALLSDAVHPFISQPIVEFALRTPAYLFSQGGVDRALERTAFSDIIPNEIANRTHKGFINHQLTQAIAKNAGMLREFVLEGHLVGRAGIDRADVERLFAAEHLQSGDRLDDLLSLITAEAWLAPWARQPGVRLS